MSANSPLINGDEQELFVLVSALCPNFPQEEVYRLIREGCDYEEILNQGMDYSAMEQQTYASQAENSREVVAIPELRAPLPSTNQQIHSDLTSLTANILPTKQQQSPLVKHLLRTFPQFFDTGRIAECKHRLPVKDLLTEKFPQIDKESVAYVTAKCQWHFSRAFVILDDILEEARALPEEICQITVEEAYGNINLTVDVCVDKRVKIYDGPQAVSRLPDDVQQEVDMVSILQTIPLADSPPVAAGIAPPPLPPRRHHRASNSQYSRNSSERTKASELPPPPEHTATATHATNSERLIAKQPEAKSREEVIHEELFTCCNCDERKPRQSLVSSEMVNPDEMLICDACYRENTEQEQESAKNENDSGFLEDQDTHEQADLLDFKKWEDATDGKQSSKTVVDAYSDISMKEDKVSVEAVNVPESNPAEEQQNTVHACGICFDDFARSDGFTCPLDQAHFFCNNCIRRQAEEIATCQGGNILFGFQCLSPGCKATYNLVKIEMLLDENARRRLNERFAEVNVCTAMGNKAANNSETTVSDELLRCKKCNYMEIVVEATKQKFNVFSCDNCGYEQCRLCERDWDEKHRGKSCKRLDKEEGIDEQQKLERERDERLTQVVVRICHNCDLQFDKVEGCNKMTCDCGATMCYLCREADIGYEHFCGHEELPCNECDKPCILFEVAEQRDEAEIARIEEEFRQAMEKRCNLQHDAKVANSETQNQRRKEPKSFLTKIDDHGNVLRASIRRLPLLKEANESKMIDDPPKL